MTVWFLHSLLALILWSRVLKRCCSKQYLHVWDVQNPAFYTVTSNPLFGADKCSLWEGCSPSPLLQTSSSCSHPLLVCFLYQVYLLDTRGCDYTKVYSSSSWIMSPSFRLQVSSVKTVFVIYGLWEKRKSEEIFIKTPLKYYKQSGLLDAKYEEM